jgi:hypothetical protein
MLQYAFGRGHELRGDIVTFNKNEFGSNVRDREERDFWPAPHLDQGDATRYVCAYGLDMFRTKVSFGPSVGRFEDTGIAFDPRYLNVQEPTTLRGLWWSEEYFKDVKDQIRDELLPAFAIPPVAQELAKTMQSSNSVFIHVRRGDYTIPKVADFQGQMTMPYYEKALELVASKHPNPRAFIFSDDTEWCLKNTPWGEVVQIRDRYIDLWLMRQCRHAIIANSSYSWWGAWLGDDQTDRVVVGPERWLAVQGGVHKNGRQDSLHIMPERWVSLDI